MQETISILRLVKKRTYVNDRLVRHARIRDLRSSNVSFAYFGSSLMDIRYLDTSKVRMAMPSVSKNLQTGHVRSNLLC